MMSRLAIAALQVSGSLEWEWATTKPVSTAFSSISSVVMVALMAMPPPKCFEMVKMSGTTPSCSKAHIDPNLASPVCASSRISSIPRRSQRSFSSCSQPGGGSMTPPALNSGSVMTAAMRPSACASSSSKLVSRQV